MTPFKEIFEYESGSLDLKFLDKIDRELDLLKADPIRLLTMGIHTHQEFENVYVEYFVNTNVKHAGSMIEWNVLTIYMNPQFLMKSGNLYLIKRVRDEIPHKGYIEAHYTISDEEEVRNRKLKNDLANTNTVITFMCEQNGIDVNKLKIENGKIIIK